MTVSVQDLPRSVQKPAFQWRHVALVLVSLGLSAYIDVITGYEVSVFLLYTVPVALATRRLGRVAGLMTAVLATVVWVWADKASGHTYSRDWYLYVNAFNRMVCFLLTVAAIRYVAAQKSALVARFQAFTGDVPVCQQCHRIGDDGGYWRPFDSYLTEFGGAQIQHKVCPDCARRGYARAGYRDRVDQVG
jgi:hypothetical protein